VVLPVVLELVSALSQNRDLLGVSLVGVELDDPLEARRKPPASSSTGPGELEPPLGPVDPLAPEDSQTLSGSALR
jgi:hypothetical protein